MTGENSDWGWGRRVDESPFDDWGARSVYPGCEEGVAYLCWPHSDRQTEWMRIGGVPITSDDVRAQMRGDVDYDQARLRAATVKFRQTGGLVGDWERRRGLR